MFLRSLVVLVAAASAAMAQSNNCTANPMYPACDVVDFGACGDAYGCFRVPLPPAVPKWTAFVKSVTDESTYPWSSLPLAVAPMDGGATPGGPNAKGGAWGTKDNEATESYTCPEGSWALTFDDGPVLTDQIMAILKKHNAVGTFFVIGSTTVNNATHIQFIKDLFAAGHQIALHTWTHRQISLLPTDLIISEIMLNALTVYNIIGKVPRYFRPPYSAMDDRTRFILKAMGLRPALWNIESNDAGIGSQAPAGIGLDGQILTVQNVVKHVKDSYARKYDPRWNYFPGDGPAQAGGAPTYLGVHSLEHEITHDDVLVAEEVVAFMASTGLKSVYVDACDQFTPNGGFYLDDNAPLVQFIKTIKLPLTASDLEPFTGTLPPITNAPGATGTTKSGGAGASLASLAMAALALAY